MTFFASLLIAVALTPQTPPQTPTQTPPSSSKSAPSQDGASPAHYTLGPQDVVRVTVLQDETCNSSYRVDADGYIAFPYLQRVAAAGLTIGELQDRIRILLGEGHFIRDASVRAEIEKFASQSVIVSGEVRQPNEFAMTGSMTLLRALAMAGSPTSAASSELTVAHTKKPGSAETVTDAEPRRVNWKDIQMGKSPDIALQDGDLVNVPKAQTFYVTGYVRSSGMQIWEPGITIEQAVAVAGGLAERGSDRKFEVNRMVDGKTRKFTLHLQDKVQPNDTITVVGRIF